MCKRRPGLRCVSFARTTLTNHRTRVQSYTAEVAELTALKRLTKKQTDRLDYLTVRLDELNDDLRVDAADLAACYSELRWMAQDLVRSLACSKGRPSNPTRDRAWSVFVGMTQRTERLRAVAMMPSVVGLARDTQMRRWLKQLADARSDMACMGTQLRACNGDVDSFKRWRDRHKDAAHAGHLAHARITAAKDNGTGWWQHADDDDREVYYRQASTEADFITPTQPQTVAETAAEMITRHHTQADSEVDPRIDSAAWSQHRSGALGPPGDLSELLLYHRRVSKLLKELRRDPDSRDVEKRLVQSICDTTPEGWALVHHLLTGKENQ